MKSMLKCSFVMAFILSMSTAYTQDERKLDYFDAITVTGDVELVLVQGEEARAYITAEGISEDEVSMYIKGKTLKIQLIEGLFKGDDHVRIEVTYERLRALKATAGAMVFSKGAITGDQFDLRASSGAQMELSAEVNTLVAGVSEGAIINMSGMAETQEITAATGGQYEGMDFGRLI